MGVKPAIGRKSNKNPPIFSHEFVIQNHADIVSCVVMFFLVGLMVQATSPVASLFISLHHNVSGVEPTRELPKGEPFLYEAGWKDGCAVFFYSLVCIVMHAILQEYFLDKISKKFHLSKSRLSALNESGQLIVFHLVTLFWGGDAIMREGFVFNISKLWDAYPDHPMSFLLKLWWIVQAAYWLHTIPELYFQRIKKDEWAGRTRSAAIAFAFVAVAYGFKFQRVGVCLVVLHSLAEFVAHSYRLNNILRGERDDFLDKFVSLVNGSVFVAVRLCSLVLGVLTFYFGLAGVAPLLQRVAALSVLVTFQVYLMYNFISETIKQRQESRQLAQSRPKKEKKEKPKKEKVKKVPTEESDLPEVDQNTNKTLRQRQATKAKFVSLVNGSVFVAVRLCSLVLGVLTFYFGLAGVAPLLQRVAALSVLVTFQVYLMYNFISETIKQRQESRQLAQSRPKKEKKEKPKKEKVKKVPTEESDLPEVDQNTNKTLRQRQATKAK
ncbi:translocating chain-associated membrane protein 1 [Ostrinia furnacalis]|uniref:translocating chain-associated membrane protein 1 n=2 Tax=Ostrinia TaxID=29056 RepID=UPI00103DD4D8|nr:translocating chain-associated membrane protein 1 [Ostrinia furnacalis]